MHTQQLSVNQQEPPHEIERSEEACVWAEICVRLIEHSERTSIHRTKAIIRKLYCLTQMDRECFMVFLNLMTGDLTALTRSYEEEAKKHALDKQAVQQRIERVIASLTLHFPEVARAVVELRHITADIPDHPEMKGYKIPAKQE